MNNSSDKQTKINEIFESKDNLEMPLDEHCISLTLNAYRIQIRKLRFSLAQKKTKVKISLRDFINKAWARCTLVHGPKACLNLWCSIIERGNTSNLWYAIFFRTVNFFQ
ncbi:hypothetical protein BpHYR1_032469 [Brachionus plicatilis]|uniref:Uncharacterized protein n=1 Tax=Brachionus plicatilis TaxID=10195 RepID=A0A3M7T9Y8_BRAPC|nr:hypothetical protein BpHYR1_032469 [Brachionus plicatilis]